MPRTVTEQVDFVKNQNAWPSWPTLPLKRWVEQKHGPREQELGYLWGSLEDEVFPVVYLGNIWDLNEIPKGEMKYISLDAIFEDGWEID